MYELALIIDEYATEFGWINEDCFCIWVSWYWIDNCLDDLRDLYSNSLFDDGGISAKIQDDCICIELSDTFIDIESMFPKDKYKH